MGAVDSPLSFSEGWPAPDGGRRRPALTVEGRPGAWWGVQRSGGAYKGVIAGAGAKGYAPNRKF